MNCRSLSYITRGAGVGCQLFDVGLKRSGVVMTHGTQSWLLCLALPNVDERRKRDIGKVRGHN